MSTWNKSNEFLVRTEHIINCFIRIISSSLSLHVPMINFLCALYYEQKETFEEISQFELYHHNQTIIRNHVDLNQLSTIYGSNIIKSYEEISVKFTWDIIFGHFHHYNAPIQIGITQTNEQNSFIACYGINEQGDARFSEGKGMNLDEFTQRVPIMHEYIGIIEENDVLSIILQFNTKRGKCQIFKNDKIAITYPEINKNCDYRLFVSMKNMGTKCTIQNYYCKLLQ